MAESVENVSSASGEVDTIDPIHLNVKTIDSKQYGVSLLPTATVPDLKEQISRVTGVVISRQRIIFQGKVLRNDQTIASYSISDGHTVHLVIRPEDVGQGTADQNGETSNSGGDRQERRSPRNSATQNVSMLPGGLIMGASFSVPTGTSMSVPLLQSLISSVVNAASSEGLQAIPISLTPEPSLPASQESRNASPAQRNAESSAPLRSPRGGSRRLRAQSSGGIPASGGGRSGSRRRQTPSRSTPSLMGSWSLGLGGESSAVNGQSQPAPASMEMLIPTSVVVDLRQSDFDERSPLLTRRPRTYSDVVRHGTGRSDRSSERPWSPLSSFRSIDAILRDHLVRRVRSEHSATARSRQPGRHPLLESARGRVRTGLDTMNSIDEERLRRSDRHPPWRPLTMNAVQVNRHRRRQPYRRVQHFSDLRENLDMLQELLRRCASTSVTSLQRMCDRQCRAEQTGEDDEQREIAESVLTTADQQTVESSADVLRAVAKACMAVERSLPGTERRTTSGVGSRDAAPRHRVPPVDTSRDGAGQNDCTDQSRSSSDGVSNFNHAPRSQAILASNAGDVHASNREASATNSLAGRDGMVASSSKGGSKELSRPQEEFPSILDSVASSCSTSDPAVGERMSSNVAQQNKADRWKKKTQSGTLFKEILTEMSAENVLSILFGDRPNLSAARAESLVRLLERYDIISVDRAAGVCKANSQLRQSITAFVEKCGVGVGKDDVSKKQGKRRASKLTENGGSFQEKVARQIVPRIEEVANALFRCASSSSDAKRRVSEDPRGPPRAFAWSSLFSWVSPSSSGSPNTSDVRAEEESPAANSVFRVCAKLVSSLGRVLCEHHQGDYAAAIVRSWINEATGGQMPTAMVTMLAEIVVTQGRSLGSAGASDTNDSVRDHEPCRSFKKHKRQSSG